MIAFLLLLVAVANSRMIQLSVDCSGGGCDSETAWTVNGEQDPDIICQPGDVLVFNINAPPHPFFINTHPAGRKSSVFSGVQGKQGISQGQLLLTCNSAVQAAAPLYYQCGIHPQMRGRICVGSCNPSQSRAPSGNRVLPTQTAVDPTPDATIPLDPVIDNTTVTNDTNTSGQIIPTLISLLGALALILV